MGSHTMELFYLYICGNLPVVMAGGVIWIPYNVTSCVYISVVPVLHAI